MSDPRPIGEITRKYTAARRSYLTTELGIDPDDPVNGDDTRPDAAHDPRTMTHERKLEIYRANEAAGHPRAHNFIRVEYEPLDPAAEEARRNELAMQAAEVVMGGIADLQEAEAIRAEASTTSEALLRAAQNPVVSIEAEVAMDDAARATIDEWMEAAAEAGGDGDPSQYEITPDPSPFGEGGDAHVPVPHVPFDQDPSRQPPEAPPPPPPIPAAYEVSSSEVDW